LFPDGGSLLTDELARLNDKLKPRFFSVDKPSLSQVSLAAL
jgi:hypothetical protein